MKFTKIPENTFKELQMNTGVLCDTFTPASGTIGNILGATTGGISFADALTFTDFGEDIDNCPKNTMELKRLDSHEVTLSGTYVTATAASIKKLMAVADIDSTDETKITPRNDVKLADYGDIWWIGDYSDKNDDTNGGFMAIHLINALSTGGFQLTTSDKSKGQMAFTYTGHYSIEEPDKVPYEVYVSAGK